MRTSHLHNLEWTRQIHFEFNHIQNKVSPLLLIGDYLLMSGWSVWVYGIL